MSGLRKSNRVIAIACSDLHLSENAPVARAAEPSWFDAMRRPLEEIAALQKKYSCPILFAGDLFDRWDPHPVLINFSLDVLPEMQCIPGNHDTPYHNLDLLSQSAYWTLIAADKISDASDIKKLFGFDLHAFPFGVPVEPVKPEKNRISVALIHAYMHIGGSTAHRDAPAGTRIENFNLKGYTSVFVGDNHFPWSVSKSKPNIMNCGTMMRRRADEIDYKPGCGLLYKDGTIERYKFDCSQDKFTDNAEKLAAAETATGLDLTGLAEELRELAAAGLDFRDTIRRRVADNNMMDIRVKKIVLEAAGL